MNGTELNIHIHEKYRYPSTSTEKLITWIMSKLVGKGIVGLKFRDKTVYVGNGDYICTITPPNLSDLISIIFNAEYRVPFYYTKGRWNCESGKLYELLKVLLSQEPSILNFIHRKFSNNIFRDKIVYRLFPMKVKENIADHYNTHPDFMKLILGDSLAYTCAFFDENHKTLYEAQNNKINKVIERISLSSSNNVLDLGCGWGQIAEIIANNVGCSITGINITPGQIQFADSVKSNLTRFINTDYLLFEPEITFDKAYSIGMLEHIGKNKHNEYFKKLKSLVKIGGKALVHCIVRKEDGSTNSWIDDVVFPGSYIPKASEVIEAIEKSGLTTLQVYSHKSENYYKTLLCWEQNFRDNYDQLLKIMRRNTDAESASTIMRIWEFYLVGSKLVFDPTHGYCYNMQFVLENY